MAAIQPYLNFESNCEEAFNFYKSVFGGEFSHLSRFKDVPSEHAMPAGEGEKIMHVSLPIGQGTILMGSDTPAVMGAITSGNNFSITIAPESEEEADKLFNRLSADGQIIMPLDKAFWGAYFGMLTDKFGIQWSVNYEYNPQQ